MDTPAYRHNVVSMAYDMAHRAARRGRSPKAMGHGGHIVAARGFVHCVLNWVVTGRAGVGVPARVRAILGAMPELTLSVAISAEEFLQYYRGAREVRARATTGQWVRFPALRLRPFVTASGVHGTFRLRFDDRGQFMEIARLG